MFYDTFVYLCKQRGVSPSKAAIDAGISKSLVTKWRTNQVKIPSPEVLTKLSDYFHVPVSELIGEENEKKPLINDDEELTEYLEILKTRPEMRMLFQLSKDATKDDVEAAVRIIEAIRKK